MHAKYPDDLEVTAFYALALLGSNHGPRDYAVYMRAAALAESVYAKNPEHPGAVHYLIHAFDDPVHAPLGLKYANIYATIAPAASHALHMPAHIYFALGMWDEAAVMNERSAKAADDRVARKKLGVEERGFHALIWLTYAYLQQGRYQDAHGILTQLESDAAASGSARTRGAVMLARAAWIVETRHWTDAKAHMTGAGSTGDTAAADLFAIGFAAAKSGSTTAARDARQQMDPQAGAAASVPGVMAVELDAAVSAAAGRRDEAVTLARKAATLEDALSFEFGPPNPVKPAHELAGEMLLDAGRPAEAQKEFAAALKRTPGRALSLLGLFRAATAAGDAATARRASDDLRKIWHRADPNLPELKELRAGNGGV
jgi:tetratricopeptide (TPR) repeat protein